VLNLPPARPAPTSCAPAPTGPLSERLLAMLARAPVAGGALAAGERQALESDLGAVDPLADDDLHLALYICFELSYAGFSDVDDQWESELAQLEMRLRLGSAFLDEVARQLPPAPPAEPQDLGRQLFEIERADEGPGLSRFVETRANLEQFREFVVHRSAYQLKEADPHSLAIPRLAGGAKVALLEVQSDEYGGGRPERMHSHLFAETMDALDLDPRPNAYVDRLPGSTLATVNLMSALGGRRARRGAIVGHLAMFEMTSSIPNRRYGNALRRLGAPARAVEFYDEHVEADAVHENIAAYDLAGGLARDEPSLAEDILFGARALLLLEAAFAGRLLERWEAGLSSLREPAAPTPAAGR
jgi:hypothetical protein